MAIVDLAKRLVEKLVSRLRQDPNYKLRGDYSVREMFAILRYRFGQIIRGGWLKIRLKSSKGLIFCGRQVVIEHSYKIKAENSLIIEDGVYIDALSVNGLQLGRNVNIGKRAIIRCSGVIANKGIGIKIGNNSAIGAQSFLGGQGGIEIGSDVILGPGVKIFSENHNFSGINIPIRLQGENRKGVSIGNNCWIGSGVIILDGVEIGNGCVIAAGTIVTKSISENTIYRTKLEFISKPRLNN